MQDHKGIIATTRNHRKEKNGVICDRFRLVIPFDKPITDLETYKYNMRLALDRWPWIDKNALDGARFFFPSNKVIYLDSKAIYSWETKPIEPCRNENFYVKKIDGKIPLWCLNFINDGTLCRNNSRHLTVYAVAYALFEQGFSTGQIYRLITRAPINWRGVSWEASVADARKKTLNAKKDDARPGEKHIS